MGVVTFVNIANGQEATAEFPLHPGVVGFITSEGESRQLYREEFDRTYRQKAPALPKSTLLSADPNAVAVDFVNLGGIPPAPQMIAPGAAGFILGHEAWFQKLWDEIKLIRAKVDAVLDAHPILVAAVERIEKAIAGPVVIDSIEMDAPENPPTGA